MSGNQGLIRPYSFLLVQANRLGDAACILVALLIALWGSDGETAGFLWTVVLALLAWGFCAEKNHVYRSWRVASLHQEFSVIWRSWVVAALFVVFMVFVFEILAPSAKSTLLLWLLLAPVLLFATRVVGRVFLRATRSAGRNFRVAAIVGANQIGRRVASRLLGNGWMGIRPIGYFEDRSGSNGRDLVDEPISVVGTVEDLVRRAETGEIDIVYVAMPMRAERRTREIVERLADTTASIYYVTDFAVFDLLYAQWETLAGIPILRMIDSPFEGFNGFAKRAQDVVLASVLLALCAVPMLAIALAVRLGSPGPALYRQRRHGLDGHQFTIWKFRTMTYSSVEDDSAPQATRQDPRVTPVGRFLRRTSLDELPQLFNVLQGTMSLVGPRPHPPDLNERHRKAINRFVLRHKVRPGITGWAQVNGYRGRTETREKMQRRLEYDLEYINNWSLWFDLRILILTALRGWRDQNAY